MAKQKLMGKQNRRKVSCDAFCGDCFIEMMIWIHLAHYNLLWLPALANGLGQIGNQIRCIFNAHTKADQAII